MWQPESIMARRELEILPGWQKFFKYSSLCWATLNLQMDKEVKFGFAPTHSVDSCEKNKHLCMGRPQNLKCCGNFF